MSLPLTAVYYLSREQNPACVKAAGLEQITGRFAVPLFSAAEFVALSCTRAICVRPWKWVWKAVLEDREGEIQCSL